MTITERQDGDVTILHLKGRLVFEEGVTALRTHIRQQVERGRLKIVLDLGEVTYIDSAGVGALVEKFLHVRRKGGDIKLLHLSSRSHRLMSITRLSTVFDVFEAERDAVRSFSDGGRSDRSAVR
jgi:anti-sigma B factor antagonist